MAIDFFQKEVRKVEQRFNETFGATQIVNLSARFNVIFAIINLGLIAKEINKQSIKQNGKKDIEKVKEFMRTKEILNNAFDNFENEKKQNKPRKENESCEYPKQRYARDVGI